MTHGQERVDPASSPPPQNSWHVTTADRADAAPPHRGELTAALRDDAPRLPGGSGGMVLGEERRARAAFS